MSNWVYRNKKYIQTSLQHRWEKSRYFEEVDTIFDKYCRKRLQGVECLITGNKKKLKAASARYFVNINKTFMSVSKKQKKKKPTVKTLILSDTFALENSFHLQTR